MQNLKNKKKKNLRETSTVAVEGGGGEWQLPVDRDEFELPDD